MKYIFLYNFLFNDSQGYYTKSSIPFKQEKEKYSTFLFNELFISPENNFDFNMALYVSRQLNNMKIEEETDIGKIYISRRSLFILTCCNTENEMFGKTNIAIRLIIKYCDMSPVPELKNISSCIQCMNHDNVPICPIIVDEKDDTENFADFFGGKDIFGYTCSIVR